jgi:hypothetical protein
LDGLWESEKFLFNKFLPKKSLQVLDVGCGTCFLSLFLPFLIILFVLQNGHFLSLLVKLFLIKTFIDVLINGLIKNSCP